jgi:uncharacterized protein YeaO (DUF488 family)
MRWRRGNLIAMTLRIKRVYESPEETDGYRILVEHLWPRGLSKDRARLDLWLRDAGASDELRRWFGHDPVRWEEFRRRYFAERDEHPEMIGQLRTILSSHPGVTLLFSARDSRLNNALALMEYLMGSGKSPGT